MLRMEIIIRTLHKIILSLFLLQILHQAKPKHFSTDFGRKNIIAKSDNLSRPWSIFSALFKVDGALIEPFS